MLYVAGYTKPGRNGHNSEEARGLPWRERKIGKVLFSHIFHINNFAMVDL
jgi:hypothetical protein